MTEDLRQREIALRKELAKVKAQNAHEDRKITKNRDFTMGIPTDTSHKAMPSSSDVPDVVTLPPRRRGRKENIPF